MRKLNPNLTSRQQELLNFIIKYQRENNYFPTHREMIQAMKVMSPAPIQALIKQLTLKGYLKKKFAEHRQYELIVDREYIPTIGYVCISGICY
jgi:repressor LexA